MVPPKNYSALSKFTKTFRSTTILAIGLDEKITILQQYIGEKAFFRSWARHDETKFFFIKTRRCIVDRVTKD